MPFTSFIILDAMRRAKIVAITFDSFPENHSRTEGVERKSEWSHDDMREVS